MLTTVKWHGGAEQPHQLDMETKLTNYEVCNFDHSRHDATSSIKPVRLTMKLKFTAAAIALFMFAGAAGTATANDAQKTTHKKTRTLTGCLQKSEDAHEYNFTSKNGGTWEIKSDNVSLGEHVGHTVKIVGVVSNATAHGMKEDVKAEMKEHGMDKHTAEHGHMTVTHLTMVADSCPK
jgi:hypothetical protein